jgi:hypothetical protein
MKFYIGTDSSSGQEFNNKEAFLKELSLMIDDCEANGGTQFDVTVDADASCFYDPSSDDDGPDLDEKLAKKLADEIGDIDTKRSTCNYGFWGSVAGEYGTGYYCKKKKQFVSGTECLHCLLPLA